MFINYAHRGVSQYYPENTLSAFYAGIAMGANGIETDIHETKDGILVLFHDDDISRVTDNQGFIMDYTYDEIIKLLVYNSTKNRTDKILSFYDFRGVKNKLREGRTSWELSKKCDWMEKRDL